MIKRFKFLCFLQYNYLNVAACMTRELAESGSGFVITIINECDLVPCFSSGSLDELRVEVCKYYCKLFPSLKFDVFCYKKQKYHLGYVGYSDVFS